MTAIQVLAKLMIEDSKKKSFNKTEQECLSLIEQTLNESDLNILATVKAEKAWRIAKGGFGIYGSARSEFLKQLDQFIFQAEYLSKKDATAPQTPIKRLALLTIADIEESENQSTSKSRRDAVKEIKTCLNNQFGDYSDDMVICLVKAQKNKVINSRQFGLRGHDGSNFLKKINFFLHQAEYLIAQEYNEKLKTNDMNTPALTQSLETLFSTQSPTRSNSIKSKLLTQDQERNQLEEKITALLDAYYPNEYITSLWKFHLHKVMLGEKQTDELYFFDQDKYRSILDSHLDLKEYVDAYFKLLNDPLYKNYLRDKSNQIAYEEDMRTKALQRKMDGLENTDECGLELTKHFQC